jgi:hypothetical protein
LFGFLEWHRFNDWTHRRQVMGSPRRPHERLQQWGPFLL